MVKLMLLSLSTSPSYQSASLSAVTGAVPAMFLTVSRSLIQRAYSGRRSRLSGPRPTSSPLMLMMGSSGALLNARVLLGGFSLPFGFLLGLSVQLGPLVGRQE